MGRALSLVGEPMPPPDFDELMLLRARRGEREAFRKLVEHFERPVFALLSRMLFRSGRESLVEDLAQETFLRVHANLGDFGPSKNGGRENLRAWILTIATRLAIDELRKRAPVVPLDRDALAVAAPGDARADHGSDRMETAQAIARAVAQLSPEHRATFLLREVHEMDYESIAQALAVDVGTVKSRLNRARTALRRALQGFVDE